MIWKKQPVGSKLADLQNNKASKDAATQSAAGLMSASDKTKLDGVATGATAVSVVNSLDSDSTTSALSAAQGKALNSNTIHKDDCLMGTISATSRTFTLANSTRSILILTGITNSRSGLYFIGSSSSGEVTILTGIAASDFTIASSGNNKVTLTTSTTSSYVLLVPAGSVTE